jgi:hypothetical protein
MESNSQANLLVHLSSRLSLLAHSNLASSTRTVDYDNILYPLPGLSLADRMAISLKDNLDRVMMEIDNSLNEMEMLCGSVDDTLVALCHLVNTSEAYSGELYRGVKHVQQVYFNLVAEVRGIVSFFRFAKDEGRRDLWYRFTSDDKRTSFMLASTLGDILMTPSVEWDGFAKEWIALGGEEQNKMRDEVDDLAEEMGNWGKVDGAVGFTME